MRKRYLHNYNYVLSNCVSQKLIAKFEEKVILPVKSPVHMERLEA